MLKQGKDPVKIKTVLTSLVDEEPLAESYRNHMLAGSFGGALHGFRVQANTQSFGDLQDSGKTGVAVLAERLVQTLSA